MSFVRFIRKSVFCLQFALGRSFRTRDSPEGNDVHEESFLFTLTHDNDVMVKIPLQRRGRI